MNTYIEYDVKMSGLFTGGTHIDRLRVWDGQDVWAQADEHAAGLNARVDTITTVAVELVRPTANDPSKNPDIEVFDKIYTVLAQNIECSTFEGAVIPALGLAREVLCPTLTADAWFAARQAKFTPSKFIDMGSDAIADERAYKAREFGEDYKHERNVRLGYASPDEE